MIEWIAVLYITTAAVITAGAVVFLGDLVYLALRGD